MIALFRRKLGQNKRTAEQIAITPRDVVNLVTNVYGRAIIHLNASQVDAKYSYWLTLSRADAETLRDKLSEFLAAPIEK